MKQSELKSQLDKEQEIKQEEFNKFWADFNKKPKIYKNLVCKNIRYTIGGTVDNCIQARCWYCDKCGRSGTNYDKNSMRHIRKIDKFIEEECDLQEG